MRERGGLKHYDKKVELTGRQTDRQTDGRTDGQTCRQTGEMKEERDKRGRHAEERADREKRGVKKRNEQVGWQGERGEKKVRE